MTDTQEHIAQVLTSDNLAPLGSPNTRLIAAAFTSGITFATSKPFLDTIEHVDGQDKRTVTWSMNGTALAEFWTEHGKEEIGFIEFRRRYNSREWVEANPNHPISYMHAFSENLNRLRDRIKTMKPLALVRKGKRIALIPHDATAERRAFILGLV